MTRRQARDVVKLLLGGSGLFAGLSLLAAAPLTAVLIMLSAMSFLLFPVASLCGAEIRPQHTRDGETELVPDKGKTE